MIVSRMDLCDESVAWGVSVVAVNLSFVEENSCRACSIRKVKD